MLHSMMSRIAVAACLLATWGAARAAYVVTPFDVPGASSTDVWDISDTGQLVGTAYTAATSYGYVYSAGALQRLNGPAGAAYSAALGISSSGAVVGSWGDSSTIVESTSYVFDPVRGIEVPVTTMVPLQRGFIYQNGTYTSLTVPFEGADSNTYARAISPDGRYISGLYGGGGFVLDRTTSVITQLPQVGSSSIAIPQGINSYGQMVGNDGDRSYLRDLSTGATSYIEFAGASRVRARAINDHGQIAGFLNPTDGGQVAWIGTADGYQTIGVAGAAYTVGEGINNHGQVVGLWQSTESYEAGDGATRGFIATPAIDPVSTAAGAYTFSTAVVADVPIFIDPLVAVGYDYKVGAGDPLFKTVGLPIGIGDEKFVVTVGGQSFEVMSAEIFDFTAHGFANGVAAFTVTGIEPASQLDPHDPTAFVTRLTFVGSGMFTGSQTALTADYTPNVPEPASWALMLAGSAGVLWLSRRRSACSSAR